MTHDKQPHENSEPVQPEIAPARDFDIGAPARVALQLISGEAREIEFPPDVRAEQLVRAILDKLGISRLDQTGRPILWTLQLSGSGQSYKRLRPDDIVGEHVCQLKDPKLLLLPELCAG